MIDYQGKQQMLTSIDSSRFSVITTFPIEFTCGFSMQIFLFIDVNVCMSDSMRICVCVRVEERERRKKSMPIMAKENEQEQEYEENTIVDSIQFDIGL